MCADFSLPRNVLSLKCELVSDDRANLSHFRLYSICHYCPARAARTRSNDLLGTAGVPRRDTRARTDFRLEVAEVE